MSAPSSSPYRKVRGGGFSWKGRGTLWLGEDHLLEVTSSFIVESYRRFFFPEIRAFVIQRTRVRLLWAWVLGIIVLLAGGLAGGSFWTAYSNRTEDWHAALYVPAVLFGFVALVALLLWILNFTFGPSCACQVLTPTGWHTLSAPRRLGPARRAQAEIAGLVQALQGPPPTATPPPAPVSTL